MVDLDRELYAARQRLLDLTMRNRLLNYRASSARTIAVISSTPQECFEDLIVREVALGFKPKPAEGRGLANDKDRERPSSSVYRSVVSSQHARIDSAVDTTAANGRAVHKRLLQTNLEADVLEKRLLRVHQLSRSFVEEQGYGVLYLALGILDWTESVHAEARRRAPLVLVPVELERSRAGESFRIRWTGEDVSANVSLQAKLLEQSVCIPDLVDAEEAGSIDAYLRAVELAVVRQRGWRVVQGVFLDLFSFTKYVMYKDLDPDAWPEDSSPADHPLIRSLFAPGEEPSPDAGFPEEQVDEKLRGADLHHVLDADSSQTAVIEDVKSGRNLVVQGPPGTGKSQTITNIIAELLAAGKKVLFVSEKMAALEVVQTRLTNTGLAQFCLELHSRKTNKRRVLEDLQRTLAGRVPGLPAGIEKAEALETLKTELNEYASALREPVGRLGLSPYALYGLVETAKRSGCGDKWPRVEFAAIGERDEQHLGRARESLQLCAQALRLVGKPSEHPWRMSDLRAVLPRQETEIAQLVEQSQMALKTLEHSVATICRTYDVDAPDKLEGVSGLAALGRYLAHHGGVEARLLLSTEWDGRNEQAEQVIADVEALIQLRFQVLSRFKPDALGTNVPGLWEEYTRRSRRLFRLLDPEYRSLKREVQSYFTDSAKRSRTVRSDLNLLLSWWQQRERVCDLCETGALLFGSRWRGEASSPTELKDLGAFLVYFRRQLLDRAFSHTTIQSVSKCAGQEGVSTAAGGVLEAEQQLSASLNKLLGAIDSSAQRTFGCPLPAVGLREIGAQLVVWSKEMRRVREWGELNLRSQAVGATMAAPLLPSIRSGTLNPGEVLPCFDWNVALCALEVAFRERAVLSRFHSQLHEAAIQRFIEMDKLSISLNRGRVARMLTGLRPTLPASPSPNSEAGVLKREFNRKRGHLPIRRLMEKAGGLIQAIKPCFLMSPLSLAQFLDPRTVRFDAVVFDEASQVRPEDALGALLRGRQLVVVGDRQQLPPTTFFDHLLESDDESGDSEPEVADMESILHLCCRCLPEKSLRWHYRSRHESLVAVSNQEFYDNRLLIYPSPFDRSSDLGLQFVHLRDSVYDRGLSGVNREEAKEVARRVVDHYDRIPNKTLGVGAFNIRQQRAIADEIEYLLARRPDLQDPRSYAHEPLFVKNLETIQGDERDVIFLSVGFGFDRNRRLTLNFGPLNNLGGERRLNVLITRARERCVVFANFRADDLPIDATTSRGVHALKTFLQYAETGRLPEATVSAEDAESPFEDSVAEVLKSRGWEVRRQVGCVGFRIDIAVVDPHARGRYLVGVECDGATYHSSRVARDRDRLRQEILENQGWRLHRVWSTEWYRNRAASEAALLRAVDDALRRVPRNPEGGPETPRRESGLEQAQTTGSPSEHDPPRTHANQIRSEPYVVCSRLPVRARWALHEEPVHVVVEAVTAVVQQEGPVHVEEVVRRLRDFWGAERAGSRIQGAVRRAVHSAAYGRHIRMEGEFLWPTRQRPFVPRRRIDDPPPRIDLICDEEIQVAAVEVLRAQFATSMDDLIAESAHLLGIMSVHQKASQRIGAAIDLLVRNGKLKRVSDGMLNICER